MAHLCGFFEDVTWVEAWERFKSENIVIASSQDENVELSELMETDEEEGDSGDEIIKLFRDVQAGRSDSMRVNEPSVNWNECRDNLQEFQLTEKYLDSFERISTSIGISVLLNDLNSCQRRVVNVVDHSF